ncbi:methylated-DNA--[protein]-cysteine S-methyltransferase [Colibacter massiliensis]|uniref:methylated-DNA--[protein]-cysteine S-methyltransferase n=1 Tax=Colibacter massiliensis TaxID=1852379 RepID=UPI00266B64F7|nr:methylated-DNA--[protein]-cysteine S-methyltransferase [Colibacter massiliensis]
MQYVHIYHSPVGPLTLTANDDALTGLWFETGTYTPDFSKDCVKKETALLKTVSGQLDTYFAGRRPQWDIPLQMEGTAFRRAVWDILRTIPYGETVTYGEIATSLAAQSGKRASARAVGGAVGHNPISVIVPCHRVIGSDGSLTGYAGGMDRKKYLLALEGAWKPT